MPHEDELAMLREETETLARFLSTLQREYARLEADFAALLQTVGEPITVPPAAFPTPSYARHIERIADPATGAITFRLTPDDR
ncbi:MAG: hypothetical protein ACYDAR_09925 [Thermomicrobiales bacterium]